MNIFSDEIKTKFTILYLDTNKLLSKPFSLTLFSILSPPPYQTELAFLSSAFLLLVTICSLLFFSKAADVPSGFHQTIMSHFLFLSSRLNHLVLAIIFLLNPFNHEGWFLDYFCLKAKSERLNYF